MVKYFDINQPGYSVKCKLYCEAPREIDSCIIFLHGFGGHKDNKAAERFAENVHSKMKRAAVLVFDWPCHGKDVRKRLTLDDCMLYLEMVIGYARTQLQAKELFAYGTSFGGFMVLKYIHDRENPFRKIALRCPAVTMYETMKERLMTPENKALLERGKEALAGFDRTVKVDNDFLEEIRRSDIRNNDYMDYADDILIIQGSKDEIIAADDVLAFADNNVIECMTVDGADHRFQNLDHLKLSHSYIIDFFTASLNV